MKKDNTQLYIYGGVALLAYFGVIRPILKKLGVATGRETLAVNNAQTSPAIDNPFKPEYYRLQAKNITGAIKQKTQSGLEQLYKTFYSGFGFFYDDEDKIKGVFVQLPSKYQVSQFAEFVQKKTGQDIITFMKRGINQANPASGLNDTDISAIIDIVNKKPIFTR